MTLETQQPAASIATDGSEAQRTKSGCESMLVALFLLTCRWTRGHGLRRFPSRGLSSGLRIALRLSHRKLRRHIRVHVPRHALRRNFRMLQQKIQRVGGRPWVEFLRLELSRLLGRFFRMAHTSVKYGKIVMSSDIVGIDRLQRFELLHRFLSFA